MMNEGEMATTMPPSNIFHLVDTSTVKIECGINKDEKRITVGKEVEIELDAYSDEVFTGTISVVNPMVDPSSRTFKVKIDITNPGFKLESGMFAGCELLPVNQKMPSSSPSGLSLRREQYKRYLWWRAAGQLKK